MPVVIHDALRLEVIRRDAAGESREAIAGALSLSRQRVAGILEHVSPTHVARLTAKLQRRRRSCLMHGGEFMSEGRHHRICDQCKKLPAWRLGTVGAGAVRLKGSHRS